MKAKVLLAICTVSLAVAACNAAAPTAPSSRTPNAPAMDGGPGSFGSGGFSDTTKTEGGH